MAVASTQLSPPGETLEAFYKSHYEAFFLQVARYIGKHGGTLDDAKDIYHDALILYYERLDAPGFALQTNEEAYIMGIVKNRWAQHLQHKRKDMVFTTEAERFSSIDDVVNHDRLYTLIVAAGKKCLDLLSAFYGEKTSLKNIASSFGFRSEHSAAVQKYKCLEKVRETVKQNALCHEDFFE